MCHWTRLQKWVINIKAMARNRPRARKIKITNCNMRLDLIQGVQSTLQAL